MSSTPARLYRNILREVRLADSIHKFRTYRKQSAVYDTIRKTFEERVNARPADGKKLSPQEERLQKARIQEMVEVGRYLQARRIHMMLVERYNGGADMTQEERARLSARRVGLNMPKEYDNVPGQQAEGSQQ
ncbi:hypothetical protein P389DRAFT_168378 [Cystobasidium minutum MCA 4210]|uniref:uncharacterized protein n=1 Tax=Cystobasidium minutum MCA 4210 TaxID=1397322 RepID=UPI0034CF863B|eukprot:jgi/Rhomi1/168378/fgenesh1_kg.2_\